MYDDKGAFRESEAFKILSKKYGASYKISSDVPDLTILTYTGAEIERLVSDLKELDALRKGQGRGETPRDGLIGFSNPSLMMALPDILRDEDVKEIDMIRAGDSTGRWNVDFYRGKVRAHVGCDVLVDAGYLDKQSVIARLMRTVATQARRLAMLEEREEEYNQLITYSETLTREILAKFKDAPHTDELGVEFIQAFSRKIAEHQMWAEQSIADLEECRAKLNEVKKWVLSFIPKDLLLGEPERPTDNVAVPYSLLRPILVALGWKNPEGGAP